MKFVVALLAVCALGSVSAALMEENYQFLFTSWASQHHKSYHTPDEFQYRYQVFKHNLDYISSHTTRKPNATYTLKMNKFGDLTNDEFVAKYTGYVPTPRSNALVSTQLSTSDLPASVDWNAKGMVTPVKNQGSCGSCWAFSTTGSTESAHAIKTGNLISLSEQELVDCSKNGNEGCNGGDMVLAFQWIMQAGGLCSESDYPYEGVDGTCPSPLNCTAQFNISGYKTVTVNSESQLQAAVAMQPVSVAVDAAGLDWQFYFGGVVSDACGYQLDHGVLAAGYGTDAISGQQFWLVKNSWGADWGESGYIRLLRNAPNTSGQGECGIAMDPSYPIA